MTLPPIADTSQSGILLTGERHVLELIATGAGLHDVLDALCRVIDEQSGLMSAVYLLDRDGKQMTFSAGPDVPDVWRQATRSFAATPTNGACGAAVNGREQVIVADVPVSPLFTPWLDAARVSRICRRLVHPVLLERWRRPRHICGVQPRAAPSRRRAASPRRSRDAPGEHCRRAASNGRRPARK